MHINIANLKELGYDVIIGENTIDIEGTSQIDGNAARLLEKCETALSRSFNMSRADTARAVDEMVGKLLDQKLFDDIRKSY